MMLSLKPKLSIKQGRVDLTHGAGGRATNQLISQIFLQEFGNEYLTLQDDAALLANPNKRLAFTTDSYVITPLFFPGGNIGELSVYGTINDLATKGAKPLYLSASFIIEEGFALSSLQTIANSMGQAAKHAGVMIVTGDTKVVEKGACDGIFITTSGIGAVADSILLPKPAKIGDKIIINGDVGDHGIAILSKRENLSFITNLNSDCAPLSELVDLMLDSTPKIRMIRDVTRGGIAAVVNEWANQFQLTFRLDEKSLPIKPEVLGACELMGLDVLNLANEGKMLVVCPADCAEKLVNTMKTHVYGKSSTIIGEIVNTDRSQVVMKTAIGGDRLVEWMSGEQLPRIC
jgi:hydrogenase expression/formation protein HypE